jgi:trimethyllysine dioxygenase
MATAPTILLAEIDDRLRVTWGDGSTSAYHWLWLRDHSHDPATLHPATHQRLVPTSALAERVTAREVELAHGPSGHELRIRWDDDRVSVLPERFLAEHRSPPLPPDTPGGASDAVLWDAATIGDAAVTLPFEEVMDDDAGVGAWLDIISRYGFGIVTGTPADVESTRRLITRVGYVRETVFGGFWEFTDDLSRADTAYTNIELLAHTDGTYSHDAPGLQMLHCLHFDGTGGASTLVDGFAIAARLSEEQPEMFDVLAKTPIPGEYLGDGVHLRAERPVLGHHRGVLRQVSFNTADRAPLHMSPDELDALYPALVEFERRANDPANIWEHVLEPGEALLFDNWRVLHGRRAYTGRRRMCGAYLNHEDFESRRRMVGAGHRRT